MHPRVLVSIYQRCLFLSSGVPLTTVLLLSGLPNVHAADDPDFYRDVRPILARACFHCHGPDEETRQAGLRLDRAEGLFGVVEGRATVAKGDSQHSELVRRILSNDPDEQMPPVDSGRALSDAQKKTLVAWIDGGAEWAKHWAFVPPTLPVVPALDAGDEDLKWSRNEIDHFILQKQSAAGLTPTSEAEPEVLVRRVFLDLIGLPPTIEEADHWIPRLKESRLAADATNDVVWRDLVNSLLARPEYGERWARLWLDLARYADTNGYEKDRPRSIWPYRDWVIDALTVDMPFDQFTIEQLAGDLLPHATMSQRIATGFHRNTMLNEEGGIDPLEFRFHAMTDRVATTGTAWLGLTVGCAQCHTHKFDPITHREYYQFMAFLNNVDEPILAMPDKSVADQQSKNKSNAARLLDELPSHWPVSTFESLTGPDSTVRSDGGEQFEVDESGAVHVSGGIPAKTTYSSDLSVSNPAVISFIQLEVFRADANKGPGRADNGNFVLNEIQVSLSSSGDASGTDPIVQEHPIKVVSVEASVEQTGFSAEMSFDGNPETGWAIDGEKGIPEKVEAKFALDADSLRDAIAKSGTAGQSAMLRIRLVQNHGSGHFLGAFRLSAGRDRSPSDAQKQRSEIVRSRFQEWLSAQRSSAVEWQPMVPTSVSSNMPHLTVLDDHSILATGDTTKQDRYEIALAASENPITALRLEALPDERLPGNGPGTTYYEGSLGDFYLNEFNVSAGDSLGKIASATESYTKNKFGNTPTSAALTIDGDVQTGWSVAGEEGQRHTAVYVFETPIPANQPLKIQMIFGRHFASSLGRFRISSTNSERHPVAKRLSASEEQLLTKPDEQLSELERKDLFHQWLLSVPELSAKADRIRKLLLPVEATTTLVMQERPTDNARPTFRHHRGEYLQTREAVNPTAPELLHEWPSDLPRNRLGFAKWLVHRSNPLTARVIVNRQWAAFFGRGIVATVDDFGIQGTAPTHPELLDWLAVTLMDTDHWSLKALHRRIVLSATYRQSSIRPDSTFSVDPENLLLSFAPRLRLEAEIVRDSIVQAAGVLSRQRGGPPVRPLQPSGITEVAYGSPGWEVSAGENRYRRSVYTFIKRTAPFAMVTTFDGPSGEACIAKRNRSNTPLQALTLLNDPMFIDLAQASGRNIIAVKDASDQQRVVLLFRRLLTRLPDEAELTASIEFIARHREKLSTQREQAIQILGESQADASQSQLTDQIIAEQATWVALSRALFGLDEVVMRP